MNTGKTIYVYFDHRSARQAPVLLGTLTAQQVRGKEVFSFEFSKDWLREHPGQALDPDLQLYAGPQFTLKPNFGLFMDSAPDRWGRKLMQRREAYRARREGESPRYYLFKHYNSIVELSNPDAYNLIHILQNSRATMRHKHKIGKLAGFHSATWQDFIRQLGDYEHKLFSKKHF